MAPAPGTKKDEITVLVTGFGPFKDEYPINPSFEITKTLPARLPRSEDGPAVRIISYEKAVNVVYEDVRQLIPRLHNSHANSVDLVLHIGMASGREYYALEQYAHRDEYDKYKDLNDSIPPADEGEIAFGDCPSTMTTSLDYKDTFSQWQQNIIASGGDAEARTSDDPGHYLCDYIYFNSLAYFGRRNREMEKSGNEAKFVRPVLFLHVPAHSSEEWLARGKMVAIALIRAMADDFVKDVQAPTFG